MQGLAHAERICARLVGFSRSRRATHSNVTFAGEIGRDDQAHWAARAAAREAATRLNRPNLVDVAEDDRADETGGDRKRFHPDVHAVLPKRRRQLGAAAKGSVIRATTLPPRLVKWTSRSSGAAPVEGLVRSCVLEGPGGHTAMAMTAPAMIAATRAAIQRVRCRPDRGVGRMSTSRGAGSARIRLKSAFASAVRPALARSSARTGFRSLSRRSTSLMAWSPWRTADPGGCGRGAVAAPPPRSAGRAGGGPGANEP